MDNYRIISNNCLLSLINPKAELRIHRMKTAMINFRPNKPLTTISTIEILQPSKYLKEYFFPRNMFLLSQEHYELIDIKVSIGNVLGYNCTVEIYENFCFRTLHPFPLAISIKGRAINTFL